MNKFKLNHRGRKIKRAAIFGGIGVILLLSLLVFTRMHNDKTVVTVASSKDGKTAKAGKVTKGAKIEVKDGTRTSDSVEKQMNVDKKDLPAKSKTEEPKKVSEENIVSKSSDRITVSSKEKVAYLTFDDGPNHKITPQILDILKQYDIKATFFVTGKSIESNKHILKREKEEGHVIGNHTYSHNYKTIYGSTSAFLQDLAENDVLIHSIVGEYDSKLIRFPGGSFDKSRAAFRQAVTEAGYRYVDWNCLNGDAETSNVPAEKLIERVKQTSQGKNSIVILMHDATGKETTVQALPQIIEFLKSQGYTLKTLEEFKK